MNQEKNPNNFIQKYPSAVKMVESQDVFEMLYDPLYEPIIVVLRDGPLTISELKDRYNSFVAEKLKTQGLTKAKLKEAISEAEKSETTIYRYIKKLEELNIVFQVGRQIDPDKNTTKALYSRTAVLFYPMQKQVDYWDSKEMNQYVNAVTKFLNLYLPDSDCTVSCIGDLLKEIDMFGDAEIKKLLTEHNEELDKITRGFGFSQMDKVFEVFGTLLLILKSPEFLEKLQACFKK